MPKEIFEMVAAPSSVVKALRLAVANLQCIADWECTIHPSSASWADAEIGGQFSGETSGRDLLASAGILARPQWREIIAAQALGFVRRGVMAEVARERRELRCRPGLVLE
jgi:hypothetical protein